MFFKDEGVRGLSEEVRGVSRVDGRGRLDFEIAGGLVDFCAFFFGGVEVKDATKLLSLDLRGGEEVNDATKLSLDLRGGEEVLESRPELEDSKAFLRRRGLGLAVLSRLSIRECRATTLLESVSRSLLSFSSSELLCFLRAARRIAERVS